ncbi:MAG TPA: hypothetical protein PLB30_09905, partial [Thermoleophilia bacterium]|nr:hypothetical protein [Thermoleophilia bacterium]HQJ98833.1 hypothetical protein [Thermoleophilia bacterium]
GRRLGLAVEQVTEQHGDDVGVAAAFERHGATYAARAVVPAARGVRQDSVTSRQYKNASPKPLG